MRNIVDRIGTYTVQLERKYLKGVDEETAASRRVVIAMLMDLMGYVLTDFTIEIFGRLDHLEKSMSDNKVSLSKIHKALWTLIVLIAGAVIQNIFWGNL